MVASRRRRAFWLALVIASCLASAAVADDWPQFLGPHRDNIAHDAKGLARSWPAGGPKVLWTQPLGIGFAGPVIYGDSVLLLDREDDKQDVLRRLRLTNGEEVWRFTYSAPGSLNHNGSRTTPATDGKLVFAIGPFGHFHAVNFADRAKVWQHHLLNDWDAKRPHWGVSTSPLLHRDLVIVAPWGKKAALVAYHKNTGKVAWATPNPKAIVQDYQSPVPMTLDGKAMIVAAGRRGYVIGVDAGTGKQLWSYEGYPHTGWNIPSPVIIGDGRVLITGGYGAGSAMFKVEQRGGAYTARELWKNRNMGTKIAQAVLYKGSIYGNSADSDGGLRCLDLKGNITWDSKADGRKFGMGNLLIADDLIFLAHGGNGRLHMIEASPRGYNELGHASVLSGNKVWAPMAYKDGKLVLRDLHKLVCVDLTK
jgi:outer membrane protein assembly factor BamB